MLTAPSDPLLPALGNTCAVTARLFAALAHAPDKR